MIKKAYRWLGLVCMLLVLPLSGAEDRGFIRVKGYDLVDEQGAKFFIRGTNLGHWLNPEGWKDTIVKFAESDRSSYAEIQKNRPDQQKARALMRAYIENCKNARCRIDRAYLDALKLTVPAKPNGQK